MKLGQGMKALIGLGLMVMGIGFVYLKSIQSIIGWFGVMMLLVGLVMIGQYMSDKQTSPASLPQPTTPTEKTDIKGRK